MLENKTHSQAAGVACNILCDIVGVKEFVNIIEKYVMCKRSSLSMVMDCIDIAAGLTWILFITVSCSKPAPSMTTVMQRSTLC